MGRQTWDETWMAVADAMALRSRCSLRQIGCVIVSPDNSQLFVGYNGPPAGLVLPDGSNCQSWCERAQTGRQTSGYGNCVTAHAEANALIHADHSRIQNGTLYVTSSCCWECGKLVANSGVSRVVMRTSDVQDAHRNPVQTRKFMRDCGLEIEIYDA